jgi:GTP-dependent phosphoenolpyruvate carboxykinase
LENGKFTPSLELDYTKRADLAATCATPGYAIIHQIMRCQVDKFVLAIMNTEAKDKDVVFNNFLVMKAAAQFYEGITRHINEELMHYTASSGSKAPVDGTEGILDIGELPQQDDFGAGDSILNE